MNLAAHLHTFGAHAIEPVSVLSKPPVLAFVAAIAFATPASAQSVSVLMVRGDSAWMPVGRKGARCFRASREEGGHGCHAAGPRRSSTAIDLPLDIDRAGR
ncbi:MAG: hypothetical protein IPJ85_14215 [Flavobacteriales bacterium]|nr:hypothetical protein [Flavobacteriales bacterium]